jgi:membrane protease subunit HflC
MKRNLLIGFGIVLAIAAFVVSQSVFVIREWDQAIVLRLGAPVRTVKAAGLHFKLPFFIEDVKFYHRRLLDFDAAPQEVTMVDQRRMVVDAFARYKISDPVQFYQTTTNVGLFNQRMQAIMNSSLRNVLGQEPFAALLSNRRAEIMRKVRDQVISEAANFGVTIEDVRFVRADLHASNSEPIFNRMKSEREREAREARAQGNEVAARIRAEAEREQTVLLADANRESQIIRGQGDAETTRILADAFNRDPQFYDFIRSLEAQRKALADGATMVLTPDSDFFRFFRDMQGASEVGSRGRR